MIFSDLRSKTRSAGQGPSAFSHPKKWKCVCLLSIRFLKKDNDRTLNQKRWSLQFTKLSPFVKILIGLEERAERRHTRIFFFFWIGKGARTWSGYVFSGLRSEINHEFTVKMVYLRAQMELEKVLEMYLAVKKHYKLIGNVFRTLRTQGTSQRAERLFFPKLSRIQPNSAPPDEILCHYPLYPIISLNHPFSPTVWECYPLHPMVFQLVALSGNWNLCKHAKGSVSPTQVFRSLSRISRVCFSPGFEIPPLQKVKVRAKILPFSVALAGFLRQFV